MIAADSQSTMSSSGGGDRKFICEKLYRKKVKRGRKIEEVIVATAGETSPGLVFLDWYGSGKEPPTSLVVGGADFTCLVLTSMGLYEFDAYCRGELIIEPNFYAIGSGAKAALGALHAGASARRAVEIACQIDPSTGPPVVTMRLGSAKTSK